MKRVVAVVFAGALTVAACGSSADHRVAAPLPSGPVPAIVAGATTSKEEGATAAFASAGPTSMVATGGVWAFRGADGQLVAALQVAVLKPRYDGSKLEIRRGVRDHIETGRYRWKKVAGQWVGIQELAETRLYLWFPPRADVFEVLQVRRATPDPEGLVAAVVEHQRTNGADREVQR